MTNAHPQDTFDQERKDSFTKIIEWVEAKAKAVTPPLIIDIHAVSPGAMQQSAEKESWELLAKGLRHLKDGAPGGQPGSMAEALSRASLRNSSLASSLGVKQPQFEQIYFNVDYTSGHEAAVFYTKRLIEAAEGDFSKSRQIIQQKIFSEKPFGAFGIMTDVDPELRDIFDAVRKSAGVDAAPLRGDTLDADAVSKRDLADMRKQMVTSFNMLVDAYTQACETLKAEVGNIPAPVAPKPQRPGKSGQTFDF
jgi:hypothetical protein